MRNAPFLNLVVAVVVAIALGWLLVGKQAILLPIVMAVISVQFMVAAVEALGRLPILRHLRGFALRMLVLVALVLTLPGMAAVVAATVREIIALAPARAANLIALLKRSRRASGSRRRRFGRASCHGRWPGSTCKASPSPHWAVLPPWG